MHSLPAEEAGSVALRTRRRRSEALWVAQGCGGGASERGFEPGGCGTVGWALDCGPQGCWFAPNQGRVRGNHTVGDVPSLPLPLPLSLKINQTLKKHERGLER